MPFARSAIEHVGTLLESALTATGQDIGAVATHFQSLDAQVEGVLTLTSAIVDCVREDWVQSTVPTARGLDSASRRFIAARIESVAAIGTVFTDEARMIENLLTLTGEQRSIAREGRALGVLASIEVARLGADGRRFGCMARELDEFSTMVSSGADEMRAEAARRRASLIDRRQILKLSLQRRCEHFSNIESELDEAIAAMETALAQLMHIPSDFQECVAVIAADISSVVEAVQMQDVTRQQTEHVLGALTGLSKEIENCGRQAAGVDARRSAILRVQALQIESARTSTEEWICKINRCLESILRVSSSDVVAVGARILAQEHGLSAQLARIERHEREGIRTIRLSDALDIAQAAELKRVLVDAIASSPRVCIQVAGVSAIDATTVQLLWAAASHAKSVGSDLILEGPESEAVARSLAGTGLFQLMASLLVRSEEEAGRVLTSRR